jgi:hypothetical protein
VLAGIDAGRVSEADAAAEFMKCIEAAAFVDASTRGSGGT